jgi:predicted nucleotidyltransferase
VRKEDGRKYSKVIKGLKRFNPRAIAFFGSHGMGLQDNYSHDVDIVVYVDQIPNIRAKEAVFSSLYDGSIPKTSFPYDVDIFGRSDEFCEVAFKQCRKIELNVSRLIEGKRGYEEEVAVFVYYTKVLYDDGWLSIQKARVKEYPQKLLATNLFSSLFFRIATGALL